MPCQTTHSNAVMRLILCFFILCRLASVACRFRVCKPPRKYGGFWPVNSNNSLSQKKCGKSTIQRRLLACCAVGMFKTQLKHVQGEWIGTESTFVWFLYSLTVKTMETCGRLGFQDNIEIHYQCEIEGEGVCSKIT